MDSIIKNYLLDFKFGEAVHFENICVIPLFSSINHSPEYVTLEEALEKGYIKITEVNESGSVPKLRVVNTSDFAVLLLEGEEVAGAKQNRVINTTILIKAKSETVIPVSCTEQGRWAYKSRHFSDSKIMMSKKIREVKAKSVTDSLKYKRDFTSNQGAIWCEIHKMEYEANVHSRTGAMKDIFDEKTSDLNDYLEKFHSVPGQRGLLVIINNQVAGLDFVSLESVYNKLHGKLVKSYCMDAYLSKEKVSCGDATFKGKDFLNEIPNCEEKIYKSVGLGEDYRFTSPHLTGSALVYENKLIHKAFFKTSAPSRDFKSATRYREL